MPAGRAQSRGPGWRGSIAADRAVDRRSALSQMQAPVEVVTFDFALVPNTV